MPQTSALGDLVPVLTGVLALVALVALVTCLPNARERFKSSLDDAREFLGRPRTEPADEEDPGDEEPEVEELPVWGNLPLDIFNEQPDGDF